MGLSEAKERDLYVRAFSRKGSKEKGHVKSFAIPSTFAKQWDNFYSTLGGFDNKVKVIPLIGNFKAPLGLLIIPSQSPLLKDRVKLGTAITEFEQKFYELTTLKLKRAKDTLYADSTQSIADGMPYYFSGTGIVPMDPSVLKAVEEFSQKNKSELKTFTLETPSPKKPKKK